MTISDAVKKVLQFYKKCYGMLIDPRQVIDAVRWRTHNLDVRKTAIGMVPGVVQVGERSVSQKISTKSGSRFKKIYKNNGLSKIHYQRELLARGLFGDQPWIAPILKKRKNWFLLPFYPPETRLDKAAARADAEERLEIARQAISVLFDIFLQGYAHCDFHAENLFWVDGQIKVVDFELMTPYPAGLRPAFPMCYDITGKGLESPERTENMCYEKRHFRNLSLVDTLRVPSCTLLQEMGIHFKKELNQVSKTFETKGKRHTCQAGRIYCSFELPYLQVEESEAQRNTERRFKQLGVTEDVLDGKTILDLGSNMGGVLFQAQSFGPRMSVGVEYDAEKVDVSQRIAAFNGLTSVSFMQRDIDRLNADDFDRSFDVVFCLAIEKHLQKPNRLYSLLSQLCSGVVFFEGNSSTDPDEVRRRLLDSGFSQVDYLGISDDDCVDLNNCRPLLVALK